MRALLLRFNRSSGLLILTLISLTLFYSVRFEKSGRQTSSARPTVLILIVSVTMLVVAAAKYRRSSATGTYEDILTGLERSGQEYCVVLRPFGQDGEIILPKRFRSRRWVVTSTLEQVVAKAVRRSLDLETYALVDQDVRVAPPGLTFMRTSNDAWKSAAERLIRRAHSIILILAPGQDIREGFAWEIERIMHYGMRSRVVIVLPPDQSVHSHEEQRRQVGLLLGLFGASDRCMGPDPILKPDHEEALPEDALLLVRPGAETSEPRTWGTGGAGVLTLGELQMEILQHVRRSFWDERQPRRRRAGTKLHGPPKRGRGVNNDDDYLGGLVEALDEIDVELAEQAFLEHAREGSDGEPGFATRPAEHPRDQGQVDTEHREAIAGNGARWGPEAPIRAEIRNLNHRIRDRERAARPSLEMTMGDRFGYRCILAVSAAVTTVVVWFMFDSWLAGIVALAYWAFMMLMVRQAAKRPLPLLYSERLELRSRLGCGMTACQRCHGEEERPRDNRLLRQVMKPS